MTENNKVSIENEAERLFAEIDKVISDPKEREELKKSFTLLQQKFLFRWETARDLDMEERIVEIVMKKMQEIYLKDNDRLCADVADVVEKKLSETLVGWTTRLGNIENALEGVGEWQISVNGLIRRMDGRVAALEKKDISDDVIIKKFAKYMSWKHFLIRKIIIIFLTVALTLLIVFQVLNNQFGKMNNQFGDIKEMLLDHIKTEVPK